MAHAVCTDSIIVAKALVWLRLLVLAEAAHTVAWLEGAHNDIVFGLLWCSLTCLLYVGYVLNVVKERCLGVICRKLLQIL